MPASWRLLFRTEDGWGEGPHPSGYDTEKDGFDRTIFEPILTRALRIEANLCEGHSSRVLEWCMMLASEH